ncbi:uncharacterized [Tachysurus ichikawai]
MHSVTLVSFSERTSAQGLQDEPCTSEVRDIVVLLEHGQGGGVQERSLWGISTSTTAVQGQGGGVSGNTLAGISTNPGVPRLGSEPRGLISF